MKKIISILLLSVVAWSMVWADDNPLYSIVCKQNDRGIVTTSPMRMAHSYEEVKLNAIPYKGYKLQKFTIKLPSGNTIPSMSNLAGERWFTMPPNDVEVSADFVPADYNIYIEQKDEYGTLSTSSGTATFGNEVMVTFTLNAGVTNYNITNVKVDKVNIGGFSDDDPWGPAYAPAQASSENGGSIEVTQTGFNTFTFVMPDSDVQITPVIEEVQEVTLNWLAANGEEGKLYSISDEDIAVGCYDATTGIIYVKDNNHAAVQEQPSSSIDYVKQLELQTADWDHSNWLAIDLFDENDPDLPDYSMKKIIRGIRGKLVDATNLQMLAAANPVIPEDVDDSEFTLNNFIPANYYGTQEGTDGSTYFFIEPAAHEYNYIHNAVWDATNEIFIMPLDLEHGVNTLELQGSFPVTFASDFDTTKLIDGAVYRIDGVSKIMKNEAPSGVPLRLASDEHYSVYVIDATKTADNVIPKIRGDVNGDGILSGADVTALYNVLLDGVEVAGDPDVNGDGIVNGSDVTALYNLLLGD